MHGSTAAHNEPLGAELALRGPAHIFTTRSKNFGEALALVERYARLPDVIVLLGGETGSGKTVLARYLHDCSPRRGRIFREVSLSALDDAFASSELFGHVRGAYTDARHERVGHFASAHGGTLFLDEIGKASTVVQRRLLRVVESGEFTPLGSDRTIRVDVRLVAATNVSLDDLVERGAFLPDLHLRLNTFEVRVPSLRERREDIPMLVRHYIAKHAPACGYAAAPKVDPSLMAALQQAAWPGNLRQLDGAIHRLLVDAQAAPVLTFVHCTGRLAAQLHAPREECPPVTKADIERALAETANNKSEAARRLGVSRRTMYRRLQDNESTPDNDS